MLAAHFMTRIAIVPDHRRLVALREERALDRAALARLAGCSVRTLELMEQGAETSLATLDVVAVALGVDMSELAMRSAPGGVAHNDHDDDPHGAAEAGAEATESLCRWVLQLQLARGVELTAKARMLLVQRLSIDVGAVEWTDCRSAPHSLIVVASQNTGDRLATAIANSQFPELSSEQPMWLAPVCDLDGRTSAFEAATLTFCTSSTDARVAPAWTDSNDAELRGVFEAGRVVNGRYLIHHTLGRGAMGRVFLATDKRLDRPVAMKVVAHAGAAMEEALAKEARMGANLNHRAIATVMDYGFVGDKSYTIFEYVVGERLREVLARRQRIPLPETAQLVAELAAALDFAHSRGIIHRDLKPENIVCQENGQVKILDLGIARDITSEVQANAYSGTPAYSSPEQAKCMPTTGKSDQYALALIAFELLTGSRPFVSSDVIDLLSQQIEKPPPSLQELAPDLPPSVESAVMRGLAKDPADRFLTCQEFASALSHVADEEVETAAPYLVGVPEQQRISFYVSHVADDSLVAKRIAEALESAGYRCWFCGRDAIPGVPFRRQSAAAIRRSAANLLLISRAALHSPDFGAEIQHAHEIGCPLLPLLVDVSQDEFQKFNPAWRLLLGGVVATEFQRRDPLEDLLERLRSSAVALQIPKSPPEARRHSVKTIEISGQAWATDAYQIAIQDLSQIVYRNDLIEDFLRHRQKHFLSGTKGIGKTLLLTYKRLLLADDMEQRGAVTMIPEGRPYLDLMSEMRSLSAKYEKPLSSLSTTKRLWAMAFRVSAVSHHPGVIDASEGFELEAFPERFRRWLKGAKAQPTVVFKELTSMQISPLNQLIDSTENFLDQKVGVRFTPPSASSSTEWTKPCEIWGGRRGSMFRLG